MLKPEFRFQASDSGSSVPSEAGMLLMDLGLREYVEVLGESVTRSDR
jgi:hypothetical protein